VKPLDRRAKLLLALLAAALLAGMTWAFHAVFTTGEPGANDFFSRWAGAHLFLTRGWDPYGEQTSLWIQTAIWGGPAGPGQDPSLFAYPFFTVFIIAPYALIGDYAWAQAAWQVTCLALVVASLFWLLRYHRWRPGPVMLGALLLWSVLYYPAARSVILGQLGLLVFFLTLVVFSLLLRAAPSRGGDLLAGVLLAITAIKPQMQFLIIPFLLVWAALERRWWFIGAAGLTLAVLAGVSFALLPGWLGEWLAQVRLYPEYTPPAVLYILTREIVPLGRAAPAVEVALDVALLTLLLAFWWRALRWRGDQARLDWTLGLTLVITHLVAPRTATTHFVVFNFALVALFRDWARRSPWLTAAALAALLVGMWALFLLTLEGAQESNLVHAPLPLLALALVLAAAPRPQPGREGSV
jgi:hypothetical protein